MLNKTNTKLLWLAVLQAIVVYINAQSSIITTIAGTGTYGYNGDNIPATAAKLGNQSGLTLDATGNIYVAEQYNNRIRKISTNGIITTIAGNGTAGYSGDGGAATSARFKSPTGLAFDKQGNLYVADQYNYCVRKINTNGIITTIAGTGVQGYSGDGGQATAAQLSNIGGVLIDKNENLYIGCDVNRVVRMLNTAGIIYTVVGNGTQGNSGDGGQATAAECNVPAFMAIDTIQGNLFISDENNNNIRKVNSSGIISTIGAGAGLSSPELIALDKAGNLYVADFGNNRIVRIDPSGIYTTVVGTGTAGYSGDGGLATAAELNEPFGVAFDTTGNLYIADWGNSVIRKVSNVGQTAGIEQLTGSSKQVAVYPNPANNMMQVTYTGNSGQVSLYDVLGNELITTNAKEIDVSSLPNGIYFLNVKTAEGVLSNKVVVQH